MKKIVVFVAFAAGAVWAGFGPLSPSAVPYEREYIWPDGKMPDVQPHQIAAKTDEKKMPGFKADDFRRPYIDWYAPNPDCKTDLCVMTISGGGFGSCCDADGYSAMASVKVWEQLRRMGIQGELHTLAKRPHCFQDKAAPGTGSYTYLDRIWEFMNHKGYNR